MSSHLTLTSKHGARILLVEDNHAVRELLHQALQEDGFEVIASAHPRGRSLLQKPFSGSTLVRKVREVLRDARAA